MTLQEEAIGAQNSMQTVPSDGSPGRRSSLISNASLVSTDSKRSSSSRRSLSSRAKNLLRLGRSSSRSRPSLSDVSVAVGDQCETISIVTVRYEEALESDVITELPIGTALEIIEVGELPRRAKMETACCTGWISVKTRLNEPLVTKRASELQAVMADFEVGGQHEVQSLVTLRCGESLDSEYITELKPGTLVKIKELGMINKRRGKVEVVIGDCIEGWMSLLTRQGELLIGKVSNPESRRASQTGVNSTSIFGNGGNIKVLLEAARCDDVEKIRQIVEGSNGLMGKLSGRPNLNCSDIRGKTALIYSAAFGNRRVVEYLLTRRTEVDVNICDDTKKSALHHSSKRARKCRGDFADGSQAEIVKMLLDAGSQIEARDHNGCTALMFAVANGDEPVAEILLRAGANVNVQDFEGHTPLDYAQNFGYPELQKMLLMAGASGGDDEDEASQSVENGYLTNGGHGYGRSSLLMPEMPEPSEGEPSSERASSPEMWSSSSTKKDDAKKRPSIRRSKSKVSSTSAQSAASCSTEATLELPDVPADGSLSPSTKKRPSVKAKAKAKVKVKAKAKTKAKAKSGGMAMAAMVAELDSSTAVAAVEVLDLKEEADEKEIAMDKLNAILGSNPMVGEIEGALAQCKTAGCDEGQLENAEQIVKQLKYQAIVQDRLRMAIASPDVKTLTDTIAEAEGCNISASMVAEAKLALEMEIPKQKARDILKVAEGTGNTAQLKAAIQQARQVNLSEEELAPFSELLAGAESKDKAIAALNAAVETRDIAQLKFSIQQAKEAGLDPMQVENAEAILAVEEPKAKARESIQAAIDLVPANVEALESAIAEGKSANLEPFEYEECIRLIQKEVEKSRALEQVKLIMEKVKEVDMTSIEAIGAAKKELSDAINNAKKVGVAEANLNEYELRRRKLHNAIEDLKGSIRVFCRVRPLSSREASQGDTDVTARVDEMTISIIREKSMEQSDNQFSFDAVFLPGTQEEVFEDCRDLVQSAADGYNVTLFAYGQTGAGKTFTMGGTPECPGISRRTIDEIFKVTAAGSARYNYTVMGSMLELYRQDLFDLIQVGRDGRNNVKKLQVRTDKIGGVVIEGLLEQECKTPDQLSGLLEEAALGRKTTATAMNAESSRSHLLFIVKIISVNRETHERLNGKICIVDLAGSERLSKSLVVGEQAKEAIEINKSLTALGDVIESLTKGNKQIPYRNHKLTMLLADSIGGTAKTLMFVNISPSSSNVDESVMSLKYATRAKKITNTTKKQKDASEKE